VCIGKKTYLKDRSHDDWLTSSCNYFEKSNIEFAMRVDRRIAMASKPADIFKYALLEQMSFLNFSQDQINRLSDEIPRKWEKHGDLVIFPQNTLRSELWKLFGNR